MDSLVGVVDVWLFVFTRGRLKAQGTRQNSNLEMGNREPARRVGVRRTILILKNHNPKFAIRNPQFEITSLCAMLYAI